MTIHVTGKNLRLRIGLRFILSWPSLTRAAMRVWDHGYITIYGLVVKRW